MRVALHFGAHKTASTYIQDTLNGSMATLAENSIAYISLEKMRETLTPQVRKGGLRLQPMLRRELKAHAGWKSLILSDENMIGGPGDFVRTGLFYPNLKERVARLARVLKDEDVRILISSRSYDTFLSSLYCEYVRHNPFVTSDNYLASANIDEISWCDPISDLCNIIGEERVTVWRYEHFREIEDQVFAALCGLWPIDLEKPANLVWESPSKKAVEALAALGTVLSGSEIQSLVQPMTSAFPKGAHNPPFEMFDPRRARELRERYERDWEALEQKFPRMTILRPAKAAAPDRQGSRFADWRKFVLPRG